MLSTVWESILALGLTHLLYSAFELRSIALYGAFPAWFITILLIAYRLNTYGIDDGNVTISATLAYSETRQVI